MSRSTCGRRRAVLARLVPLVAALHLWLPSRAAAQEKPAPMPAKPAPAPEKPAGSTFTAGWRDGFFIQNDTGDFRLQIGVLAQADARFALQDENETFTDTFAVRRLRPYLRGRIAQRFEFYVNPDFAGGTVVVQDAYVDTRFSTAFRVRLGKTKVPFGHERMQSVSSILFYDRAFPSAISPNRDLGVQVLGDLVGGTVSYQAGLVNGTANGGSADLDTNDGKDVFGRIVVRPWARTPKHVLGGLGFALSGMTGNQAGAAALPTVRTSFLQQTFLSYSGAVADGRRTRYSPYAVYAYRAVFGFAEYGHSTTAITKGAAHDDIADRAWQMAGSYVLTGESASEAGVRPNANVDFGHGHWGAWQIAARYHQYAVDEAAIRLGFATAGSSREAKAWTLGLNWYVNPYIKNAIDFERTVFDDDPHGARRPENALAIRTQLYF